MRERKWKGRLAGKWSELRRGWGGGGGDFGNKIKKRVGCNVQVRLMGTLHEAITVPASDRLTRHLVQIVSCEL